MYTPLLFCLGAAFVGLSIAQDTITVCIPEYTHTLDESTCAALGIEMGTPGFMVGTPSSCYWKGEQSLSYEAGMNFCKEKGGHLLHLYSRDVGDMINEKLYEATTKAWIGAKKEGESWKWETEGGLQPEMSNLAHGVMSTTVEHLCSYFDAGIMIPFSCDESQQVICQKDYPRAKFSVVPGKNVKEEAVIGTHENVPDSWECGLACLRKLACVGYNYNSEMKKCQLTDKKEEDFPNSYTAAVDPIEAYNRLM